MLWASWAWRSKREHRILVLDYSSNAITKEVCNIILIFRFYGMFLYLIDYTNVRKICKLITEKLEKDDVELYQVINVFKFIKGDSYECIQWKNCKGKRGGNRG